MGGAATGVAAVASVLLTQFVGTQARNRRELRDTVLRLNVVHSAVLVSPWVPWTLRGLGLMHSTGFLPDLARPRRIVAALPDG